MLFPVWGTFAEQKWVTLGERRRPRTADVTARSQRGRETPSRRGAWLAGAGLWRDWLAVLGARGAVVRAHTAWIVTVSLHAPPRPTAPARRNGRERHISFLDRKFE